MAYNLDKNPKFLLETYKQKIDTTCIHEFIDHKINCKHKCDICYKFHFTKYRTICIKCELSLYKLCAKECYSYEISQINSEPLAVLI